ncbi:MAG TPA: hypothetical protein VJ810_01610 [Blastocatellia bacterium]|nr:hypothetical protein [Blastocatellia bacterium]
MTQLLIPLDFNSLSNAENGSLKLSNYYMDYAFHSEGAEPYDGMEVAFYDEGWMANSDDIVCFDAVLKKSSDIEPWTAVLRGKIYTAAKAPQRKYFSAFIGADSKRVVDGIVMQDEQRLGANPKQDTLASVSCFAFSPKSELPNFSAIVGMDAKELHDFFQFSKYTPPEFIDGRYSEDTLIVRGGGNQVR